MPDYGALAITVSADLLDHKRALSNGLKASSSAGTASRLSSARLGFGALASPADVCSVEADTLLSAIHSIEEVNLHWKHYVSASLSGLLITAASLPSTLCASEELLKLLKYVAKRVLALLASLSKLILETLESRETTESTSKPAEGILTRLLLLVSSHARGVINSPLAIIAQSLIGFVYLCKLLLGSFCLVDVGMVLLGHLEVGLLDVVWVGSLVNA